MANPLNADSVATGTSKLILTSTGTAHIARDIAEVKITVKSDKESLELAKESVNKRSQYIQGTVKAQDKRNKLTVTTTCESLYDNNTYHYSECITIYGNSVQLVTELLNNFSDKLQDTIQIHTVSYILSEQAMSQCKLMAYKNATDLIMSKISHTLSLMNIPHFEIISLTELNTSEAYDAKSKLLYTHNLTPESDEMIFVCTSNVHAIISLPAKQIDLHTLNKRY